MTTWTILFAQTTGHKTVLGAAHIKPSIDLGW